MSDNNDKNDKGDERLSFKEYCKKHPLSENLSHYQIDQGFLEIERELRNNKNITPGEKLLLKAIILQYQHARKQR